MNLVWSAWSLLVFAVLISGSAIFLAGSNGSRAKVRNLLTIGAGLVSLGALILGLLAKSSDLPPAVPDVLIIAVSVLFAVSFGGPLTELIFHLAWRHDQRQDRQKTDPSPLRGGLWIGLLERTAIVATLWADWPEGIAVVLAVKGLGRFSELKNHQAAEQFILGTFASCLIAAGGYGLGVLLLR
ncbi:hypothetical protein ACTXI4_15925 [Glutamicibacter ardleyensis]|uniref:hypothetical protein n=1 Tax=Glutamicibacter ardleyensis TaxID=225894 RepID=UPI003FB70674